MIETELSVQVICPTCHLLMQKSHDGVFSCVFKNCTRAGVQYRVKSQRVQLEEIVPQQAPEAII